MKFIKITIQFESGNIPLAEELISDIFFSFDLKGVVCEVPLDEPDEGFGTDTLPPPEHFSVTGYLPCIDASGPVFNEIRKKAISLEDLGIKTLILSKIVDEKEWADAWKDYFQVTRITDRITIKPRWRDHVPGQGEIVIHLDPGMAFGTGTHPTTAMCLKLIEVFLKPGNSFLDVGTGSGILLIAAAKLGAASLLGIDTDETAVAIARENLALNQIDSSAARLLVATLDQTEALCYDFIAANIIARVILDILPDISRRMKKGSIAVFSGIIREQVPDILAAVKTAGLRVIQEESVEEWVTLAVQKYRQ